MSTFFFNTENAVNPAWADVAEGLNAYYAGPEIGLGDIDIGAITDHDQQISSYVKIDRKLGLYTTQDKKIVVAMASPLEGQTIGIKEVDLAKVKEILSSGVKVVYFGYVFKEERVAQNTVIEESTLFGRNTLDNNLTDFISNEKIEGHISAALWMAFYKIKNCDIYYVVLNDNLLESSVVRTSTEQPDLRSGEDVIEFINSHDGNFKNAVFRPSITDKNGKQLRTIGENIIVSTNDIVSIDVFGTSNLHKIAGRWLADDELPEIDLEVESSGTHTVNKNRITVQLFNNVTTVSYRWVTGTDLDTLASDKEKVRYDFIIIKL